ncbi:MAG: DUF488 domain-containing protein [Gammaproteobacteria bacterium]|jgi:uncharacterized protein (DUF488 family)
MFTIGHSTHPIDEFIALLEQHAITCVCDVRSAPYSRRNPQFNRETLKDTLQAHGIAYVWLGKELGARTEHADCYVDGKVSFERLARAPSFRHGIERLIEGDKRFTIALMCAEKEPLDCHRTILVARQVEKAGIPIEHILFDGETEAHRQTIDRLIDRSGLERTDLFLSEYEIVERAYELGEATVAYENPAQAKGGA